MKTKEIKKFRENYKPYDKICVAEGLKLATLYDEKDKVKSMGAMWKPDPNGKGGFWWMPQKRTTADVVDELNSNKMIIGSYGIIDSTSAENNVDMLTQNGEEPNIYKMEYDGAECEFREWELLDAIFVTSPASFHQWHRIEDARVLWDEMIAKGYRIVKENS